MLVLKIPPRLYIFYFNITIYLATYLYRAVLTTKARGIEFDPYLSEPHQSRNAHHEIYLKSRLNPTKI